MMPTLDIVSPSPRITMEKVLQYFYAFQIEQCPPVVYTLSLSIQRLVTSVSPGDSLPGYGWSQFRECGGTHTM